MPFPNQQTLRNRLLKLMTPEDFARLTAHLQPVPLPKNLHLAILGAEIDDVYFLETGLASVVATSPEGLKAETGLCGSEGMTPSEPILASSVSTTLTVIQIAGEGWRIQRTALSEALEASATLRNLMLRYVQTQLIQVACTALSNAVHPVELRLARWLLMCDDRIETGAIPLTHDYLSVMLAVRRPSVTTALHVLAGQGLIRAERGCVSVRDRAGLESFARDAYGQAETAYRRLIGTVR